MPFRVQWHDDALEELAAIWLRAHDPESVSKASAQIDHVLSADPYSVGEPVGTFLRSHVIIPLAIPYEIADSQRRVTVVDVEEWHPSYN